MPAAERQRAQAIPDGADLDAGTLEREAAFYRARKWGLDSTPTVRDLRSHLLGELEALASTSLDWQREEAATNVYLLSCAVADATDDYLAGDRHPHATAPDVLLAWLRRQRAWRLRGLRAWRERLGTTLDAVLQCWLQSGPGLERSEAARGVEARAELEQLLNEELPARLLCRRARVPAAFDREDLTHHDVLALVARFAAEFPDRERPLLVVGLRTAGSYLAPLTRAALALRGYRELDLVTFRTEKGFSATDEVALARCAAEGGLALVVDGPPSTADRLANAVALLRRAGVAESAVALLVPVHPGRHDWNDGPASVPLQGIRVVALPPEEWHKQRLIEVEPVELRMREVFLARGYVKVSVSRSLSDGFPTRLERVFELRLQRTDGTVETRCVLVKSAGWGWLAYHAFLAAEALAEFVPKLLSLRDGMLYEEWLPRNGASGWPREALVQRVAAYVAARARKLPLDADPGPELDPTLQDGVGLLAAAFSGADASQAASFVGRVRHALTSRPCPSPTLIDGQLRPGGWIVHSGSLLKIDLEQHELRGTESNLADPAYDLAEVALHFGLSWAEEQALLRHYRRASGDESVEKRLFLHKLLAGTAAVRAGLNGLVDARLAGRHLELNRSYNEAQRFLATQVARFCGRFCRVARPAAWGSPLVVVGVDGVLDRHVFGFPSTTEAGIRAMALLQAHGLAAVLDSSRTLGELQEYCRAYGCVGAVAECGSVVWDAVSGSTRTLLAPESRVELSRLDEALRRIPGVFLDDACEHSLRVYSFESGRTVPLPTGLVHGLLGRLHLARLRVHQTARDTAIVGREVDKGKGLLALLRMVERPELETIAIGASETDLPLLRVAKRSWAPSDASSHRIAQLLGCRIVRQPHQLGLLQSVRSIVHPDGRACSSCQDAETATAGGLLWDLLKAADRRPCLLPTLPDDPLALLGVAG